MGEMEIKRMILQQMNRSVFKKPVEVMEKYYGGDFPSAQKDR